MVTAGTRVTRRELLASAGAAALAAGFPAIAQARPLRIGALISQADARGQDETMLFLRERAVRDHRA